jgi:metal-sulfur cluster biosynthetic enzyme
VFRSGNLQNQHCGEMKVEQLVKERLSEVIDPETGLDVGRMDLVHDLRVDGGHVTLVFRPTSPVCPMAFKLAADIRDAVRSVSGVSRVTVKVENFRRAAELESLLEDEH